MLVLIRRSGFVVMADVVAEAVDVGAEVGEGGAGFGGLAKADAHARRGLRRVDRSAKDRDDRSGRLTLQSGKEILHLAVACIAIDGDGQQVAGGEHVGRAVVAQSDQRSRGKVPVGSVDDRAADGKWNFMRCGDPASDMRFHVDSNRAYLNSQLDLAKSTIKTTRQTTELSRARLDLVRQRQLARIGRVTNESLKPLETKVTDCEKDLKSLQQEEANVRAKVETQLDAWKTAEDAYIHASNDYDTGIWE